MPARLVERRHGDLPISTEPERVDVAAVHRSVSGESYRAAGRSAEIQRRAIEHGHVVAGASEPNGDRAGFAGMVTDPAAFARLADVDVLETARGTGRGTSLVETIVEHAEVTDVKLQFLATRDAHEPYARFGDNPLDSIRRWMHRRVES